VSTKLYNVTFQKTGLWYSFQWNTSDFIKQALKLFVFTVHRLAAFV